VRATSERASSVLGPPAHRAAAPVRWALAPVKRYIAEAEAPLDPTAPASVPATLLMRRARPDRRLHASVAETQPAKRGVAGVNGTLAVSRDGISWEPGRAGRLLGAESVRVPWPSVWNAVFAPAERGIPTRIVNVETAAGGFEMQLSDRAAERVDAALRHFGP
jgi:hypothetical protein